MASVEPRSNMHSLQSPNRNPVSLVLAIGVLVVAFVVYQGVSTVVLVGVLVSQGLAPSMLFADLAGALAGRSYTMLTANAVGQIVGLAGVAYAAARLQGSQALTYLRLRRTDGWGIGAGVLGALFLIPLVQWLAEFNSLLPLPPWLRALEAAQMELIASVLAEPTGWLFNLLLLAATPAFCEELLFRGYFQRKAERAVGVIGALVLSGVVFAFFHLRLTQVLPLALLGGYLAYVVWRTDSLWSGIAAHLGYNGLMVLIAPTVEGGADPDMAIAVPWYLVLAGTSLAAALMFWLHNRAREQDDSRVEPTGAYPDTSLIRKTDT